MIPFLFSEPNIVFLAALLLMVLIAAAEALSLLSGFGLSQVIEGWLPDPDILGGGGADLPHAGALDAPTALDGAGHGASVFTKLLAWIRIGRVPLLMLIVVFLCVFGVIGVSIQLLCLTVSGFCLPTLVAVPLTFAVALPISRACGGGLARILPADESSAITDDSFIGRRATVILGTARIGSAAQAKLRDEHGQHHYVMVEPDEGQPDFSSGERVILVKKTGAIFTCIEDRTE